VLLEPGSDFPGILQGKCAEASSISATVLMARKVVDLQFCGNGSQPKATRIGFVKSFSR
jgi:hypothetical protein